jgi:hypothetical protein
MFVAVRNLLNLVSEMSVNEPRQRHPPLLALHMHDVTLTQAGRTRTDKIGVGAGADICGTGI